MNRNSHATSNVPTATGNPPAVPVSKPYSGSVSLTLTMVLGGVSRCAAAAQLGAASDDEGVYSLMGDAPQEPVRVCVAGTDDSTKAVFCRPTEK